MKRARRLGGCLILVLVCVAIAGGIWWVVRQARPRMASTIAPETLAFVDQADMMMEEVRHRETPYGTVKQFGAELDNGDSVLFDVDQEGAVVSFFRKNPVTGPATLSREEAESIAASYARRHYPDQSLAASAPEMSQQVDGDGNVTFYRFTWRKRDDRSGAYLPQSVSVEVNGRTGSVDGYSQLSEASTVDTQPSVDSGAAEQAAVDATAAYFSGYVTGETKLIVATVPLFEEAGEQALLWQVEVEGPADEHGVVPGALVFIDGVSGEVVGVYPR